MRLLEITNDFPPTLGGIENYVYSLTRRWDPDRLTVLTRWTPRCEEFDSTLEFDVIREPVGTLLPTKQVLRKSATIIEERSIDVIHFATPLPLGLMGPKLLRSHGIPYAVTVNGAEFVLPASLPIGRHMLKRAMTDAAVVLPYSAFLKREVQKVFPSGPAIESVPPGIDPERFPENLESSFRSPSGGPLVVSAGRLVARKGSLQLLEAFAQVLVRFPDAHLLFVGDGPELKRLRRLTVQKNHEGSVTFVGSQPWELVPGFLASGDIFALPVRERFGGLETEGFGIVFLEAAAAGLPSIGGNVGGVPDAIVDGETGLLVDGRDPNSIAQALLRLLDDPQEGRRLGKAGRERVMNEFTWDHFFTRFKEALATHAG